VRAGRRRRRARRQEPVDAGDRGRRVRRVRRGRGVRRQGGIAPDTSKKKGRQPLFLNPRFVTEFYEMAEITAGMVKALRDKTDAPMMECKKALSEANGDLDKAEEILRVRLGNKATKASARVAAEGVVSIALAPGAKAGAIV